MSPDPLPPVPQHHGQFLAGLAYLCRLHGASIPTALQVRFCDGTEDLIVGMVKHHLQKGLQVTWRAGSWPGWARSIYPGST